MADDEPVIKKQIDLMCKTMAIISGNLDKKTLNKCMEELENTLASTSDLSEFDKKYGSIYGKEALEKSYAIQHLILDLVKHDKDSQSKAK